MMTRKLTADAKKKIAAECYNGNEIAAAAVVGNVVYLAVRGREDENMVFPCVVHVDSYGDTEDWSRCMFEEDCLRCPESVLKAITEDFYEGDWVAECRKNNAERKAESAKNAALKKYPCGTVIRFTTAKGEEMTFTKKDYTHNESFPIQICALDEPRLYWVNDMNQKIDPKYIPVNYEVLA